jgi:hypothetical protein
MQKEAVRRTGSDAGAAVQADVIIDDHAQSTSPGVSDLNAFRYRV